jgi:uncharacterized protein YjbI with pentapeptide repeats
MAAMSASGLTVLRRGSRILRKSPSALVFAAFAVGIGLYAAALAVWPFLLVWWPWLLAGAAAVVALFAWWLWWRLPIFQAHRFDLADDKARADVEDNYRKTVGQLLGGAAVLIGAGFAYLQFQQQQQAAHDLLISNQVAKGFELLGNKDGQLQQRLGGIYALEGVMNTSKEYYKPVLEALCAFVRDSTTTDSKETRPAWLALFWSVPRTDTKETREGSPASDIQAALTVIGRRTAGEGRPDLSNARIPKTNLSKADLGNADLSAATLFKAFLFKADLSGADLTGADLSGVILAGADLTGADLTRADLTGADLSGVLSSAGSIDPTRANLTGAFLSDADLTRANLTGVKGLTKKQLDEACGTNVKGLDRLNPPLDPPPKLDKPCPPRPSATTK